MVELMDFAARRAPQMREYVLHLPVRQRKCLIGRFHLHRSDMVQPEKEGPMMDHPQQILPPALGTNAQFPRIHRAGFRPAEHFESNFSLLPDALEHRFHDFHIQSTKDIVMLERQSKTISPQPLEHKKSEHP